MRQRRLGTTGLYVSHLALGTMGWGRDTDPEDAANQLRAFLDAGGNLVDTANVYVNGESERVLGKLLNGTVKRDDVVLATKAGLRRGEERDRDASRRHLLDALDQSLARLNTDHVDVWQLHQWDPRTPIEETLAALDTAVDSGRARYVGISNYSGWQTAKAATWQRAWPGRAPICSTQVEYSLLQRGVEREVVPATLSLGIGILAWSPLGRGVLTGKYQTGTPADSRGASRDYGSFIRPYLDDRASRIVGAVLTAADGLGVSPLAVALAWVRDQVGVTAPIIGARTTGQLRSSLEADSTVLPEEIRTALDEISAPEIGYPEVPTPLDR
ncbi:MAG TPA: aldo/keto reductase [Mycobacteriales bacterium]|nr:aldo/keto reductase [Mycobacteriales bacterium]